MLLLCALMAGSGSAWAQSDYSDTYTSNVTLSTTGGTKAEACKVVIDETNYDGIKIGTGSAVGACKITVPKGAQYLHMHISGWNGVTDLSLIITGITPAPSNISVTADTGVANNSPFTLASDPSTSDFYKVIDFGTALENDTELTFTTSGKKRCVIFGVNYEAGTVDKTDPTITFSDGSVRVGKTLDLSTLFTSNSSGAVTYSITEGGSCATINGSVLTGVAEGSVTVKAEQAAAGSYNAGEETATITVNAALTLSSIAITTAPTKTTYTEGETFDATGMVVTATYADSSTDDVTASCTFSPSTALTTSDTEITVSYTENELTKTATQAITVNEAVDYAVLPFSWAGGKSEDFLKLVGVSASKLDSDYADTHNPYYIKFNGTGKYIVIKTDSQPGQVTVQIKKVGGASTSTLTIQESADGETFTDVEELYTTGDNNAIVKLHTKNLFKEESRFVRIYFTKEYNSATGSNIGVGPISITKVATLSLASACTDGEGMYYGTYSNGSAFVVPSDLTVSEISVSGGKLQVTDYATGAIVPANTGVMVSSTTSGDHTIALSNETGASVLGTGNMLKASSVDMTGDCKFYRLTMHNGTDLGFWWGAENGAAFTLDANKAYLAVPNGSGARAGFSLIGAGETGISLPEHESAKTREWFSLSGQRVAQPVKGLYIVNGKKVIIK